MSEAEDLVVTIEVDTTRVEAAFARAIEAAARFTAAFAPIAWRIKLSQQRDRSRLITRRKQRRNW